MDADEVVAELHRKNYFTNRRAGTEGACEYHPLFREFLLAEARRALSAERVAELRHAAACLLELTRGHPDLALRALAASSWFIYHWQRGEISKASIVVEDMRAIARRRDVSSVIALYATMPIVCGTSWRGRCPPTGRPSWRCASARSRPACVMCSARPSSAGG